ncbi:hypothetical protein ACEZDB_31545 [Streptacidiphilus sp. N1-3]|uniref:Uncharacterized protein n=1 Tax=Streptacidiphilus alkalitolerans TaxID=3342712 RepID=A0ABV6XAA9_9ACTN
MSAFRKLRDHLQHQVLGGLATLAATEINDVYALAFLVDNQDDDPRRPVLTVRHNTRAQVRIALSTADKTVDEPVDEPADSPADARWNLAYWLPGELVVIADSARDPTGAALREAWIRALGLWYEGGLDAEGHPAAIGLLALEIEGCFNEECVRLARALHSTGTLEGALGRPVPILIPEWEHGSGTAGQTLAANPAGLAREYIDWTRGQGH